MNSSYITFHTTYIPIETRAMSQQITVYLIDDDFSLDIAAAAAAALNNPAGTQLNVEGHDGICELGTRGRLGFSIFLSFFGGTFNGSFEILKVKYREPVVQKKSRCAI